MIKVNIEFISSDDNLSLLSVDSKVYSGMEMALVFIEDITNKTNNKGEQIVQISSLKDRVRAYKGIIRFKFAKWIFSLIFMYEVVTCNLF